MRKIIFFAVLLFTAFGCQQTPFDDDITAPSEELISVTIQAAMSDQESDTRVSVSPDSENPGVWKSEWQEGDVLVLVEAGATQESQLCKLSEISIDEAGVAKFTGSLYAGEYDVYCLKDYIIDSNGFRADYSKQSAGSAESCQNMPLKAVSKLRVEASNSSYKSPVLIFKHLAQVVKYKLDFSKVFETSGKRYTINSMVLSGYTDQEQAKITVPVTGIEISSSSEQPTVYCYLPPFTLGANSELTLDMTLSQIGNEKIEIEASTKVSNNTDNIYDFEVGTLNTIVARYSDEPKAVNWKNYAAETFAGGKAYSDSVNDYSISSAAELVLLAKLVNEGKAMVGKTFTLANDIDLSAKEWCAIGCSSSTFDGTFDGAGFAVKELYINQPSADYQALFGYVNYATIKNISVEGSVVGNNSAAGIVGKSYSSTVINCYNAASVKGYEDHIGGVVGFSSVNSTVTNCYNTASVVSNGNYVGGVVGGSDYNSIITNCYNTASVECGNSYVGGVVGYSYLTVTNCYWSGDVTGAPDKGVGNKEDSNKTILFSATKMTTDAMNTAAFSTILGNGAHSYNNSASGEKACAWSATSGSPKLNFDGAPSLVNYAYNGDFEIYTASGLTTFASHVNSGNYATKGKLMCDIDLKNASWTPIGNGEEYEIAYSGTFDGDGHSIVGLNVSGGSNNGMGLFKTVYGGTVKNLTVSGEVNSSVSNAAGIAGYARDARFENCTNHANVSGTKYAGGIVGYCSESDGTVIYNCVNTGTIYSSGYFAGGIVGKMFGKSGDDSIITSCANKGEVSVKERYAGGLAGANQGGWIKNSYNRGRISSGSSGEVNVGGLAGNNERNGDYHAVIEYCYSSADVYGDKETGLVVGYNDRSSVNSCYYDGSKSGGEAIGKENSSYSVSVTAYESLSKLLADLKSHGSWAEGDDGFPILEFEK